MTGRFGQFGDTLTTMAASAFITWFNFQDSGEATSTGDRLYRPTAEVFRDLTVLTCATAPDGTLTAIGLVVARRFIADEREGAFARDLIKSFIQALNARPSAALGGLADEIFFRDPVGPVLTRGAAPALPPEPSQGYQVFAKRIAAWRTRHNGLRLTFTNADDPDRLTIQVHRQEG